MGTCAWEEIHGFQSPAEYRRFIQYIEGQVQAGHAIELSPLDDHQKGLISGGRWFQDTESSEIWRLIPPDFPFRGVWESVEIAPSGRHPFY
jgi:hypothetical protein